MRSAAAAAALALLAAGACGPPSIDGAREFTGVHLDVEADPALPVCPTTMAQADAFVVSVADLLGVDTPRVDYTLYNLGGVPGGCHPFDSFTSDCTVGTHVYAGTWVQFHEMVHAVSASMGRPPPLYVEGLAEGLGTRYPQLKVADRQTAEMADVVDPLRFSSGTLDEVLLHYSVAADFDMYLIGRFGMPVFRQLYGSALFLSDPITIRRAFEDVTGVSFDDVVGEWRAATPHAGDGAPRVLEALACAAPPVSAGPADLFQVDQTISCVSGPTPQGATLTQPDQRTFDVADGGQFALDLPASGRGRVFALNIGGCGNDDPLVNASAVADNPSVTLLALGSGRHSIETFVNVLITPGIPPPATPESYRLGRLGASASACAGAPVWTAPGPVFTLTYGTPPERWPGRVNDPQLGPVAVTWFQVALPAGMVPRLGLYWQYYSPSRVARVSICSGTCDAPVSCVSIDGQHGGIAWPPPSGQPLMVELRARVGDDAPPFSLITPAL